MQDDSRRARLLELLKEEAVLKGRFELASGKISDQYLDGRRVTLHPEGAILCAEMLLDRIDELGLEPDCVGGPTLGADPLVSSMVVISQQRGRPLPGFLIRKKKKEHGTKQALEGQWKPGQRAVIVEDTVSTGGSAAEALELVKDAGVEIAAVMCIVDREVGGRERLAPHRFDALFTAEEIGFRPGG
ncbi:MAG: orotate phosphoribosyltransferase [Acidobacteriota bacterium]